jgi:hypothetical protein
MMNECDARCISAMNEFTLPSFLGSGHGLTISHYSNDDDDNGDDHDDVTMMVRMMTGIDRVRNE